MPRRVHAEANVSSLGRRGFLRRAALASGALALSRLGTAGEPAGKDGPPNVVLIISDDQGWGDYGFMGHPAIQTPRLDRLAKESLLFTRGYVTAPLCCPSLGSMVTGLHPHQNGITSNDPPAVRRRRGWPPERLKLRQEIIANVDKVPTLPRLLKTKGYLSLQTGKWWLGHHSRGGFTHGMTHGDPKRGGRHGDAGLAIGRKTMQPIYDFIDAAGAKPFFIWYAPFLPHSPHNPPVRLLRKYRDKTQSAHIARYWAMCEWLDETCGQLLDHLGKRGLAQNTLVATVMSNLGLDQAIKGAGGKILKTAVGDRYVVEEMRRGQYNVGGEQSGHIVFLDYNTTGDGLITALQVLALMQKTGKSLKELASCMTRFPQSLENISVKRKEPFEGIPRIKERVDAVRQKLGDEGRILVRYSGTEPLARVMVEGRDQNEIAKLASSIAEVIGEELG